MATSRSGPERVTREQIERLRKSQEQLAAQVVERPLAMPPRVIAAADLHLADHRGAASAVAFSYPALELVSQRVVTQDITFPYIPGLLSFREAPICLAALGSLDRRPNLVLVDGQGRAHPRRAGLACHVGVELGIPTIGVAKSILVGRHGRLGDERGSTAPLVVDEEIVGMAVRTRSGVTPVYVSVGNLITLAEAVEWVLRTTTRYRLPEPSRRAHQLASSAVRELRDS